MRLCSCQPQILHILFQSTHPLRDATKVNRLQLSISLFQSTHPLRDATFITSSKSSFVVDFNPRTPYGMRPFAVDVFISSSQIISIHAPLTGCDTIALSTAPTTANFNPRTPYGMRLNPFATARRRHTISIHAPLTGCDGCSWQHHSTNSRFQSTHPLRDAT